MMMGNSVEGRFPFLDFRLIEFAAKLPPDIKLRSLNEKYILKQGYRHLLPPSIINRVKQPYRAPIRRVFLDENTPPLLQELLSPEKIRDYGYFNEPAIRQLISKARNADNIVGAREEMALVALASVQLLHYHFIENFAAHAFKLSENQTTVNLNS
jgi:asparagine synthase (glutamine-hydrolysing)